MSNVIKSTIPCQINVSMLYLFLLTMIAENKRNYKVRYFIRQNDGRCTNSQLLYVVIIFSGLTVQCLVFAVEEALARVYFT